MGPGEFVQHERDRARVQAMRPVDWITEGLAKSPMAQWRPAARAAGPAPARINGPAGVGVDGTPGGLKQLTPGGG